MRQFRIINTAKGILNITTDNLFEVGEEVVETGPVDSRPYKVYTANIWQDGTSAPQVDSILENTLGFTPTYTRSSAGSYLININSTPANKIAVFQNQSTNTRGKFAIKTPASINGNVSTISMNTVFDQNQIDGLINQGNPQTIEIRIYD